MASTDQPTQPLSFELLKPRPLLVVISGPSGVGKDAVLKELQARDLPLHFVVTMTSRPARPGEVEGKDYFFATREEFEALIRQDEFLEYALVYDDYKGIPKPQIRAAFASGRDVVLRVDVQGAMTLRKLFPQALLIFLTPDNEAEWLERLNSRQTETPESLTLRVNTVSAELQTIPDFDYVVVNAQDKLKETVDVILHIIEAEHHRVHPREIQL